MIKWVTGLVVLAVTSAAMGQPETTASVAVEKAGTTVTLANGLSYQDLVIGTGEEMTTDTVGLVHYILRLDDGFVEDSSRTWLVPKPLTVAPGKSGLIPGFMIGVMGMRVGGTRMVHIPPALGYGPGGKGRIKPNTNIHFELELVAMKPPEKPAN